MKNENTLLSFGETGCDIAAEYGGFPLANRVVTPPINRPDQGLFIEH